MILLLEDDADFSAVVREALSLEGYEVVSAGSVAEVRTLLATGLTPQVALLDEFLPDGFGSDVCRMLKERDTQVRCLLISGDDSAAARAVAAQADLWLRKPFAVDRLVASVRELAA